MSVAIIDKLIEMDRELQKKILVIGDSMTDVYVTGYLDSCQDGCNKFVQTGKLGVPGGAGNAVRSISHWHSKNLHTYPFTGGAVKTRYMIDNKCVFRHDKDCTDLDLNLIRRESMFMLRDNPPHAVLISDYDKGLLTPEFIRTIIDKCKELDIPCMADVKREPELYRGAILKGNHDYFIRYAERARLRNSQAVTTYGDITPLVWDKGEVHTFKALYPVICNNHVGAGDCFAAHLTMALAYKFSLKEAAEIAHSAGRVYVQHPYNRPPFPQEIRQDMLGMSGEAQNSLVSISKTTP